MRAGRRGFAFGPGACAGSCAVVDGNGNPRRRRTPLDPLLRRLESAAVVDAPARAIGRAVRGAIAPGALKDALSGTWIGHALHPLLTDVVIGSFLSATLLDVLGGDDDGGASERLIAVGIAAYGPTALTGFSDWADSEESDPAVRRTGLVHAATNATALSLYTASLAARRRGSRSAGIALGAAGATVLAGGAYLGGHLMLAKGVGADQTIFDPGPREWTQVGPASDVAQGTPVRVLAGETPVMVTRDGDAFFAIHDRCSHRGCSLSDGELEGEEIVCRCHGSRFDRRDGSVRRGPATAPQPAFEIRARDGALELRCA